MVIRQIHTLLLRWSMCGMTNYRIGLDRWLMLSPSWISYTAHHQKLGFSRVVALGLGLASGLGLGLASVVVSNAVISHTRPHVDPGSCTTMPAPFLGRRPYRWPNWLRFFAFILCCGIFVFRVNVCFCCVRFSFFITRQDIGREECLQKWPILSWAGRKTLTLDQSPKIKLMGRQEQAFSRVDALSAAQTTNVPYFNGALEGCLLSFYRPWAHRWLDHWHL